MASQTMLAGMKFSITGTPNSHGFIPVYESTENLLCSYFQAASIYSKSQAKKLLEKFGLNPLLLAVQNNSEKFKFARTSKFFAKFSDGKAYFFHKFEPWYTLRAFMAGQNVRQAFSTLPDILSPCQTFFADWQIYLISVLSGHCFP